MQRVQLDRHARQVLESARRETGPVDGKNELALLFRLLQYSVR